MRKYFLLGVAALLSASTANATTDYAEVTAKATIEVAGTLTCKNIDFGTIVVKQNNGASTITIDTEDDLTQLDGDILSTSDLSNAKFFCGDVSDPTATPMGVGNLSFPRSVTIKNDSNDEMTISFEDNYVDGVNTILSIPPQVGEGDYTGSFTVTYTY